MAQRRSCGRGVIPVVPYDPVVEANRFYVEADIEPAYLESLVGAGFPSRCARREIARRRRAPALQPHLSRVSLS